MPQRRPVPNHLRTLRRKHGMTQSQLAKRLGVNGATVSRWERRITQIPDHRKEQAALILGAEPADLMGWDALRQDAAAA